MDIVDSPRNDVLGWDETFMGLALIIAMRSKDPSTQVGAVIVDNDHRILSMGYNGTPRVMDDADFPWGKSDEDPLKTKYPFVIHAERNAVLNVKGPMNELANSTVYVTLFPCVECMKSLAQAGIKRVVYYNEPKKKAVISWDASFKMAEMCGVTLEKYSKNGVGIQLEL